MIRLDQITILPTNGGVLAECQLCATHKTYQYEVTLAEIIADMGAHLARNHPDDDPASAAESRSEAIKPDTA